MTSSPPATRQLAAWFHSSCWLPVLPCPPSASGRRPAGGGAGAAAPSCGGAVDRALNTEIRVNDNTAARSTASGTVREGRGICTSGTALEREEQVPDAVVEGGGDQLGWPGRPQVGQPRVQLAEQHAHLLPGQGGAEAEVRPTAAEPDVRVGPAGDV